MSSPLLRLRGLTKRYGSTAVVDSVDLEVRSGEVYGFLGANGAGKTTTMRMLLGLIRPSGGSATVLGHPPGHPDGLAKIGAMIETPAFYPHLSGRDNLRVLARYARVAPARVAAVLATVDLDTRARDRFATYSLGMKQRLGVAAALLKDPDLLILDEPTNGLDPAGMADMRSLIRRLGAGNRAVLLSSHLMGEVQEIADRVGVISHGRLVSESTVDELRGAATLRVHATPAELTHRVLVDSVGAERVHTGPQGAFALRVGPERAPGITRTLVHAGCDVLAVHPQERSLEEAFFQLTEESS